MKIHCQKGLSVGSSVCLTPGTLGKERQVSLLWSLSSPRTILWHFTRGPTPTSLTEVWCPSEYFTSALQSTPLALQNSAGTGRKKVTVGVFGQQMEEEHFKNLVPAFALLSWVSFTDAAHTHAWKRFRKMTSMTNLWSIKTNLMEEKWTCSNSARWVNTLKTRGNCSLNVKKNPFLTPVISLLIYYVYVIAHAYQSIWSQ